MNHALQPSMAPNWLIARVPKSPCYHCPISKWVNYGELTWFPNHLYILNEMILVDVENQRAGPPVAGWETSPAGPRLLWPLLFFPVNQPTWKCHQCHPSFSENIWSTWDIVSHQYIWFQYVINLGVWSLRKLFGRSEWSWLVAAWRHDETMDPPMTLLFPG